MKYCGFLYQQELKKMLRGKYILVYVVVIFLNVISVIADYRDRIHSEMFLGNVHVAGEGLKYLFRHEYGNYGVMVLCLIPAMLIAGPVFSDEYENNMIDQIRTTQNGRKLDVWMRIVMVNTIQLLWMLIMTLTSIIFSFSLFDIGLNGITMYASAILKAAINIILGNFFMTNLFLLSSVVAKNTITSLVICFVVIIAPLFIEKEYLWMQFLPIIGMQAENFIVLSIFDAIIIEIFYFLGGVISILLCLYLNDKNYI
ncbi:MAG: ABC transporter permease [Pseudobutyrivibrio sp.]|nr:ABC transporter permease [Pseudobutyrivibrio sp.]